MTELSGGTCQSWKCSRWSWTMVFSTDNSTQPNWWTAAPHNSVSEIFTAARWFHQEAKTDANNKIKQNSYSTCNISQCLVLHCTKKLPMKLMCNTTKYRHSTSLHDRLSIVHKEPSINYIVICGHFAVHWNVYPALECIPPKIMFVLTKNPFPLWYIHLWLLYSFHVYIDSLFTHKIFM